MKNFKNASTRLLLPLIYGALILQAGTALASESASGDNKSVGVEMGMRSAVDAKKECISDCAYSFLMAEVTVAFEKTELSATQKSDRIKVLLKNLTLLNFMNGVSPTSSNWKISYGGAMYDGSTMGSATGDNSTYIDRLLDFKLRVDRNISDFNLAANQIKFRVSGEVSAPFMASLSLNQDNLPGLQDNKSYYQYGTTVSMNKSIFNNQRINLNAIFDVNDNIQITGYYKGERFSDLYGNDHIRNNVNGLQVNGNAVSSSADLKDNTLGMRFEFKDSKKVIYYANLYASKSSHSYVVPAHSGTFTEVVYNTVTNPDGTVTTNTSTTTSQVQIPEYSNQKTINNKGISIGVKIPFDVSN